MAGGQVVMRARYKSNGVKDPGVQGVLIMTEDKLYFLPDDRKPSARLNVGFRSIERQRCRQRQALLMLIQEPTTGSGKSFTFEFKKFAERDICQDFVGKVLGKIRARESSALEKSVTTLHEEQLSPEEMELRMKLLAENSREFAASLAPRTVCVVGHLSHFFGANASWIHAVHPTRFRLSLSLFTFLVMDADSV